MSEKLVIVVGDKTSHGGTVMTGDDILEICGKPTACLGDRVSCPVHGDTKIVEGFHTTMIDPNKTLAYDGCKTTCGAVLIAGGQEIVVVDTSVSTCLVTSEKHVSEIPAPNKSTEEFNLFVATVWGEAASQSEVAWQAVGSVIMNRVGNNLWKTKNDSVTTIIKRTGFDAAAGKKNREFKKAKQYLLDRKNPSLLNQYEKDILNKMATLLAPVYYENQVITQATHYYSPKAQAIAYHEELRKTPGHIIHKETPDWAKTLQPVNIDGLKKTDDLKFFYDH